MEDAIKYLSTEVDAGTNLRGNIKVQLAVTSIVDAATDHGLSPRHLKAVLEIVLNKKVRLTQAVRVKLTKCLIPNSLVSEELVLSMIFHISSTVTQSPGPSQVEILLLRWVLLVFDYLDSHAGLHKLCRVIFLFLNSAKLMPFACHLLFLLTRNSDVKTVWVMQLLSLMERNGPDPAIVGLLTCFKMFKPHMVPVKLHCSHKLFFKTHDVAWRAAIVEMVTETGSQKRPMDCLRDTSNSSKRQKQLVPEVHNACKEIEEEGEISELPKIGEPVPYLKVESFLHFLESVDKIEYPSQISACLQDSRLRLLMSCNPDRVAITRLSFWIQHFLVFGFKGNGLDDTERTETLLRMLLNFSQTVETLPAIHGFLEGYLPQWNGRTHASLILELVSVINPCSFQELHDSILKPLSKLFFSSDVYFKAMYVASLTKLIQNFAFQLHCLNPVGRPDLTAANIIPGRTERDETEQGEDEESAVVSGGASKVCEKGEEITRCLQQLMDFLDRQLVVGMRMEGDHLLLQHTVLDLLHTVASNDPKFQVPMVSYPIHTIQRLLLSEYSTTIGRLCGIINEYRHRFTSNEKDESLASKSLLTLNGAADNSVIMSGRSLFNSTLIDTMSMLWQGSLWSRKRKNTYASIFDFRLPPSLELTTQGNELTIYNNPAFLTLAFMFLTATQRKGKRLHPAMIKDFIDVFLQFLAREYYPQITELVNLNLKSRKGIPRSSNVSRAKAS